jgi:EmrB/QacA subfamily drug resistance transporter
VAVLDETVPLVAPLARLELRQRLLLGVLLGTQFMLAVDFSILNVALPAIGRGVGLSLANLQWAATAFALPAAGLTLLFGRVADLFGRRRLFFAGLVLLGFGSLLGGIATDPQVLLTARVLQGLASAMATPAALSLLTTAFPEGPQRDRALGLNGALLSGGFTTGALLGGLLTATLSWRWAFLVNVPVALVVLVVGRAVVVEPPKPARAKLDVPGALTVSLGLLALVYGLTTAGAHGWSDPASFTTLAAAVLLLGAFWQIEKRAASPLAPVQILERPSVKWGNIGGFVVFSMESAVVFLLTLYLQRVLGMSALVSGLALGLPGLSAVVAGILAPRVLGRFGTRRALVVGLVVQALANGVLLWTGRAHWGVALIAAALTIGFFGHITAIVAYTVTATSGLPDGEQGLATGLATLTQQVAIALGIPVLATIVTARVGALTVRRGPLLAELNGVHVALAVDIAVTLLAAAAIWYGLRPRPTAPEPAR